MLSGKWAQCLLTMAFVVGALLLYGCNSKTSGPPTSLAEVTVVTIRPEKVVATTESPRRTASYLVAESYPQVKGLIGKPAFREGTNLNAGDLLYQIDSGQYEAAYQPAKAALATTKEDLSTVRRYLFVFRYWLQRGAKC